MARAHKIAMIACGVCVVAALAIVSGTYIVNNVEHPRYDIVVVDGDIEIRAYPPLIVAEVTRTGDRKTSVSASFRPLADYIFAKERNGDPIAMTAPVTQERQQIDTTPPVQQSKADETTDQSKWHVRFIMPSQYTLAQLPKPSDAAVEIKEIPVARRAAVRFSGVATDEMIAGQTKRLRDWLAHRGLNSEGRPTYAYYNAPFTPGPMRRNEVCARTR